MSVENTRRSDDALLDEALHGAAREHGAARLNGEDDGEEDEHKLEHREAT